jgi:UDP-glucose 4-epimerase
MRIALTGGFGLIGSAVREHLSARGTIVTIGRRLDADLVIDLSEPEAIESLDLSGCDVLVHCAGIVDEDFISDSDRAFRQATQGMAALVRRAKNCGLKRFAYISSAHIYGAFADYVDESAPPNPLHDYAIAHFSSEQILRRACDTTFCGAVFRPCAVFGIPPDLLNFRRWRLIPFAFPREAMEKACITLATHGEQRRNFVGNADVAAAIGLWIHDEHVPPFTAVNLVGKESMTVYAFAQLCATISERLTGKACLVVRPSSPPAHTDSFEYATLHSRYVGSADLSHTVEDLIRLLQVKVL